MLASVVAASANSLILGEAQITPSDTLAVELVEADETRRRHQVSQAHRLAGATVYDRP
jgi:hypothetical protein